MNKIKEKPIRENIRVILSLSHTKGFFFIVNLKFKLDIFNSNAPLINILEDESNIIKNKEEEDMFY
jgi:hypothetical protein